MRVQEGEENQEIEIEVSDAAFSDSEKISFIIGSMAFALMTNVKLKSQLQP